MSRQQPRTHDDAISYARSRWADAGCVRRSVAGQGLCRIGFLHGDDFHVYGEGASWAAALADAQGRTEAREVIHLD